MKHFFKVLSVNFLIFFGLLFVIDFGLRLLQMGPHEDDKIRPNIKVEPGGKYFVKDSLLGYRHKAGKYKVTIKDDYQFTSRTHVDGYRFTSSKDSFPGHSTRSEIWVFGCSLTQGWGIGDEDTFAWKLQSHFSDYKVINFGTGGYGTLQFYLQFQEALKNKMLPELVIFNHADFHFERNIFSYQWRKAYARWNFLGNVSQPYADLDTLGNLNIRYANIVYDPPQVIRYSAILTLINKIYENDQDQKAIPEAQQISRILFDLINKMCKKEKIKLAFTNIDGEADFIQQYCSERGIPFRNIAVDLSQKKYNNLPYDTHPNKMANLIYSEGLVELIEGLTLN